MREKFNYDKFITSHMNKIIYDENEVKERKEEQLCVYL
jgi:hypothetical protein